MMSSIPLSEPCTQQNSISPEVEEDSTPTPIIITSLTTFQQKLWGQCEHLHKRNLKKIEYYENFYKKLELIYISFLQVMKTLEDCEFSFDQQSTSGRASIGDKGELKKIYKQVPNTLNSIKNVLEPQIKLVTSTISGIIINFSNFIDKMKEEKKEFAEYQKIFNSYNYYSSDRKALLEKYKKVYHQKGQNVERAVLGLKKIEETTENFSDDISYLKAVEKANNSIDEYMKPYNVYKEAVKKEKDLRNEFIKKQKNLLDLYYNLENKNDDLNDDIIKIFFQFCNNQFNLDKENIEDFDFIKKSLKKGEMINEIVNDFGANEKPDEEIKFLNFPSIIDFEMCYNDKTFKIFLESILFIKQSNNEEYPNFNETVEKEKNDMRNIISRLFDKYSKEDELKIMNYLKNPLKHNPFFNILSKFRNKNCLNKDKKLFDMIGKILNMILDEAHSSQNLENAKNCIIFSQTFFYYSEDNTKHFLIEKIKDHKWINTFDFWENFIFTNLKEEINKFLSFYEDITINDIEEKNEKITDKIKLKLPDLLFSQILSYINNMNQIEINKKIKERIIVEFCSKYKYLNEEKIDAILNMAFKENREIKKLKANIEEYIADFDPNKNESNENDDTTKIKKKRSKLNINYDHLKKEEKQIENPL